MQIKQVFTNHDGGDDTQRGRFEYCPFCSAQLSMQESGGAQRPTCLNCGYVQYRNPTPGVVIVIEKQGQVLLGRRAGGFGKGKWGLPQGYIEFDEDFLTAAIREVKEETGLDATIHSIINVVSNFLSSRIHTLAIVLLAGIKSGELCPCDDLETLEWFPLAGPLPDMAFEADEFIIRRVCETGPKERLPVDTDYANPLEGQEV